jgi:3-oxoacyl-[acyl-carrier-protein] synthase III
MLKLNTAPLVAAAHALQGSNAKVLMAGGELCSRRVAVQQKVRRSSFVDGIETQQQVAWPS